MGSNPAAPTTFRICRSHIGHTRIGGEPLSKCDLQRPASPLCRGDSHEKPERWLDFAVPKSATHLRMSPTRRAALTVIGPAVRASAPAA